MSYMDTGNVLGGQLITRHQCHFQLHSPLYLSRGAWKHVSQKSSPVCLDIRICLSEALASSLEARALPPEFQADAWSVSGGGGFQESSRESPAAEL